MSVFRCMSCGCQTLKIKEEGEVWCCSCGRGVGKARGHLFTDDGDCVSFGNFGAPQTRASGNVRPKGVSAGIDAPAPGKEGAVKRSRIILQLRACWMVAYETRDIGALSQISNILVLIEAIPNRYFDE